MSIEIIGSNVLGFWLLLFIPVFRSGKSESYLVMTDGGCGIL